MDVLLHLETIEDDFVWWAETPDRPGFTAAAPTLFELKALVLEAALEEGWIPKYKLVANG